MKSIYVLILFFVCLETFSNCENLVRRKRFLSALFSSPTQKNEKDKREVVYLHLPPEYIEMMHHELQSRSDAPMNDSGGVKSQPVRFVNPPKIMAVLRSPDLSSQGVPQPPKMATKSSLPRPEFHIQELPLPEIHTTNRFVTPTPTHKMITEPPIYNGYQSLPIKRVTDNSVVSIPSIKTADISNFYHTLEFNDLLKEFKLKVDINTLPDIQDVMAILGTEDATETIKVIREVANTPEGMELIKHYLKGNDQTEEDHFYNIHDDVGAGEIHVNDNDYSRNYIQPVVNEILQSDDASQYNYSPVENPITETPVPLTWWQTPLSWFGFYGDTKSVKAESIKSDAEIIAKVVHDPDNLGGLGYTRKFLNPLGHRKESTIDPPLKISGTENSRLISSEPFEYPSTLPPIQMTEEDFDKMVKDLRLSPINPSPITTTTTISPPTTIPTIKDESQFFELPIHVAETFDIDIPDPQIPHKVNTQINEHFETTRRSFESISGPVRHSPIESRTGKVFSVDPEEVLKKSKSLAADFEDDKEVVATVSNLTEQAMMDNSDQDQEEQ